MLELTLKGKDHLGKLEDTFNKTVDFPSKRQYSEYKVLLTLDLQPGGVESGEKLLDDTNDFYYPMLKKKITQEERDAHRFTIRSLFEAGYIEEVK